MEPTLHYLAPILWTKDLHATTAFYENILGFKTQANFPNFISLTRDKVNIMFVLPIEEPGDCKDPGSKEEFFPRPLLTGSIFITVEKVDEFWEGIKDKVTVRDPIANRDYLMRDFSILDNNGYELVFGEDISNKHIDQAS